MEIVTITTEYITLGQFLKFDVIILPTAGSLEHIGKAILRLVIFVIHEFYSREQCFELIL